jgi:hypothetical protein
MLDVVDRLLITWDSPSHPTGVEAEEWALSEARRLLELPEVARVELTRIRSTAARHGRLCDWLCELHLRDGADVGACVERQVCAEWLRDLRLLGMRPSIGLAGTSVDSR